MARAVDIGTGAGVLAAVLARRGVPHKVVVIGEGPAGEWLESRLPDASFIGFQGGEDLAHALASCDIFFNPSVTETFGNVTLEAMACGLPVVAARATGSASIVKHGRTGYLVPPGSITGFADHLQRYCRDIPLRAGEIFLLPPRVPHSPQRMPGSVGLVIERKRLPYEDDGLLWFCERCNHKVYEEYFHLNDIEQGFFRVVEAFYRNDHVRARKACGQLNPRPSRYEMQADSQADIT